MLNDNQDSFIQMNDVETWMMVLVQVQLLKQLHYVYLLKMMVVQHEDKRGDVQIYQLLEVGSLRLSDNVCWRWNRRRRSSYFC
jgi:hypothetical protein